MIEEGLRDSVDKDKRQLKRFIKETEDKLENEKDNMIEKYKKQATFLTQSMGTEIQD